MLCRDFAAEDVMGDPNTCGEFFFQRSKQHKKGTPSCMPWPHEQGTVSFQGDVEPTG